MVAEELACLLVGDAEDNAVITFAELGTAKQSAATIRVLLSSGELYGLECLKDEAMELLEEVTAAATGRADKATPESDLNQHSSTNQLEEYVLGQICEAELNLVELHLSSCVNCVAKLRKVESGIAFLKYVLHL